jgi:hypothetical protein
MESAAKITSQEVFLFFASLIDVLTMLVQLVAQVMALGASSD